MSLTGNLMYSAYTDKFENWFRSGDSNHWYGSNGIGIQVRVPIFDGFGKRSKIKKPRQRKKAHASAMKTHTKNCKPTI